MTDNRASTDALPRTRRAFAAVEASFGTQIKHAATDAFRFSSGQISAGVPERIDDDEHRESRSRISRYTGRTPPVPWSYEGFLRPSAAAGTPPDIHPFLLGGIASDTAANGGGYTNVGSTSDTYLLKEVKAVSMSMYDFIPGAASTLEGIMGQSLSGAIVDEVEIKGNGTTAPTFRAAGVGKLYGLSTRTTATGAPTTNTLPVTDGTTCPVGSVIAIYTVASGGITVVPDPGAEVTGDNDGAGFLVTARTANTITLDANPPSSIVSTDIVAPWSPVGTVAGSPVSPTLGSCTLGGQSIDPLEYSILIKNNHMPHDSESFQATMSGFHSHYRDATGLITFRAQASLIPTLTQRVDLAAITTVIVIGTTAGSICTLTLKAEMGFDDVDFPLDGTAICKASWKGTASTATAADEFKAVFT